MHKLIIFDKNINGDNMNQNIKCNVHDCKNCDKENNSCTLNTIKICSCGNENIKENTMCNSYNKD